MSLYAFSLKAGVPLHANIQGRVILVDSTGTAESIDITPVKGGQEGRPLTRRQKAFKCWTDFDSVILKAAVDCTVQIFLSVADVSLGFAEGMSMNVRGAVTIDNDPNNRVPVQVEGGTINVTASVQSFTDIVHPAPVAVGLASVTASNDATFKRLRFRNVSATAQIALGGAAVGMDSPIILQPGDIYLEDDAAGAHWYAIADEAGAKLTILGLK